MPQFRPLVQGFILVVLVLLLGAGYTGERLLKRQYDQRDYSRIPNAEARVGYCVVTTATIYQKRVIAETIVRPPDERLFDAVLVHAVTGEVTEQKKAAVKALRTRADAREHALQHAVWLAESCGYRQAGLVHLLPFDLVVKWLRHDPGFRGFMGQYIQQRPDAALVFYDALLQEQAAPTPLPLPAAKPGVTGRP